MGELGCSIAELSGRLFVASRDAAQAQRFFTDLSVEPNDSADEDASQ